MGKFRPRKRGNPRALAGAAVAVVIVAALAALGFFLFGAAFPAAAQHGNSTTSLPTSYASSTSISTSTVKSTTTSTVASITTSVSHATPLSLPPPYPSSQIVRVGANTTVSDAGASGGTAPYNYQWLGAVSNTTSNFTASYGSFLCAGSTAQSNVCNFQTVSGYNSLIPGVYYLKLHVADSSSPTLSTNSSVAYVDVVR